jgi:hypothetical protein
MYKKRERLSKKQVQATVNTWLQRFLIDTSIKAITLSGADPLNAIKSLEGISNDIILYERDPLTYAFALAELRKNTTEISTPDNLFSPYHFKTKEEISIKLIYDNIYNNIDTDINCYYYDFCGTVISIDKDILQQKIKEIQKLNKKEVSFIFTVSLRNKGGRKAAIDFFNSLFTTQDNYFLIKMPPIGYRGGENSIGCQMLCWAAILTNEQREITSYNIEETKLNKETQMKKVVDSQIKEMIHVLVSKKDRTYTNQDIATMMNVNIHQVAAMAAWHSGKLNRKRKNI